MKYNTCFHPIGHLRAASESREEKLSIRRRMLTMLDDDDAISYAGARYATVKEQARAPGGCGC